MSKESQKAEIRARIAEATDKRAAYVAEAENVKAIYQELRTIKGEFVKRKNKLVSQKNERDDSWKGNLYNTKFIEPTDDLIANFDSSIKAMNTNIDLLLDKINYYENKALEMDGVIGQLGILLNNISGWFEGWFN